MKLTLAYTGTGLSFRVGAYLQTNKGTDANAYGETALYSLAVTHVTTSPTTPTSPRCTPPTPPARGPSTSTVTMPARPM